MKQLVFGGLSEGVVTWYTSLGGDGYCLAPKAKPF